MSKKSFMTFYISLLSVLIASCGGGGGGSDNNPPPATAETGILLDSPVSGVNYQTATQSGVTDAQGQYSYIAGETVIFSIGDVVFPSTQAAPVVTPLDMIGETDLTDTSVINILRLLQSLDIDGDPTNGIEISQVAHTAATGLTIDYQSSTFDTDVANLVANSGSSTTVLIDEATAIDHFKSTLSTQLVDWESYYNYADNRQWNYSFILGGIGESIYEYTVSSNVNEQDVYIHGWSSNWYTGKEYISSDMTNGVLFVGVNNNGFDTFFSSPIILSCNLYETCNISGIAGGFDYSFSIYNELETITVPAGAYNDCIKSTSTDNIEGVTRVRWNCKGVGKVKQEEGVDHHYVLESISTYNP